MPQEIKTTLDFKNVGKIVNLPDGVDAQDAATVHQLGAGAGTAIWGGIAGSINDQTDLISGGKILPSLLPALAITDTNVVSSEAEMLALTAETGDIAVRTDETKTYILKGTDPSVLADWELLLTPTGGVVSVFGRSGAVTAQSGDYSFSLISGTAGPTQGGTGLTSYAKGDVLIATGTNAVGVVAASATDGYVFTWDTASGLPMWKAASGGGGGSSVYSGEAINAGGTSSYSATIPEVTALTAGQIFVLEFLHAATSSAATLNLNGFGIKSIYKNGTVVTNSIDFGGENQTSVLVYDGTNFQLVQNNMSNVAYLNGYQTFSSNNTFSNTLIASGILGSNANDFRSNIYIGSARSGGAISATLKATLGIPSTWARVILGAGDAGSTAPTGYDVTGVLISNIVYNPGTTLGKVSSLEVTKPSKPNAIPYGTIASLQVAWFDEPPVGGVENWSINAGSSKFRGTVTLAASPGTSGSTPLKLTSGTLVSTPENGSLEYDGTHLYFTIGTTRNIII